MNELYIDGQWCEASGPAFASRNPGTGETVWSGHAASAEDVDRAGNADQSERRLGGPAGCE